MLALHLLRRYVNRFDECVQFALLSSSVSRATTGDENRGKGIIRAKQVGKRTFEKKKKSRKKKAARVDEI